MLCNQHTVSIEAFGRINEFLTSIEFTCEKQNRSRIAFPDVLFTRRNDGSLGRNTGKLNGWVIQFLEIMIVIQVVSHLVNEMKLVKLETCSSIFGYRDYQIPVFIDFIDGLRVFLINIRM